MGSRASTIAVSNRTQETSGVDLARPLCNKLPIAKPEDFVKLENFLASGEDDAHCTQLTDFVARGAFGAAEKEFVHSALLRLFTRKFANSFVSWAGAKGNKQFTLKTSKVFEFLIGVVSPKFPNFQKNMGIYFNNFHKDVGKDANRKTC